MIQKITSGEYLKRYENMSAEEKCALNERVGVWLKSSGKALMARASDQEAQLNNVIQCSASWNDAECSGWNEGVRILTAFTGMADTWLPDRLYVKAARRSIRQMISILGPICNSRENGRAEDGSHEANTTAKSKETAPAKKPQVSAKSKAPAFNTAKDIIPVRPKHIDQYVHVLPLKTQERAARVQGLLREMDEKREVLRMMMERSDVGATDMAGVAKKVNGIDRELKSIYLELDAEWEKAVRAGVVTVDDLGNAHVNLNNSNALRPGKESHERIRKGARDNNKSNSCERQAEPGNSLHRSQLLRKWLIDTRWGNKDEAKRKKYQEKWIGKYREMVRLGGMDSVTDKVRKAAAHYGIDLSKIELETKSEKTE